MMAVLPWPIERIAAGSLPMARPKHGLLWETHDRACRIRARRYPSGFLAAWALSLYARLVYRPDQTTWGTAMFD